MMAEVWIVRTECGNMTQKVLVRSEQAMSGGHILVFVLYCDDLGKLLGGTYTGDMITL